MSRCLPTPSLAADATRLTAQRLLSTALAAALAGATFACTDDQDLPTGPAFAKGGNAAPLAVSPTSIILALAPGTPATLTAKANAGGTITAGTSDADCATVAPAAAVATRPMGSSVYVASFTVTPSGIGACAVTLGDTRGNQVQAQVVVAAEPLRPETLAGGDDYTCGLTVAGAAWCWGSNVYGALGMKKNLGTSNANPTPTAVAGNLTFASLAAGGFHACGLTGAGAAYCWGSGALGTTKRLNPNFVSTTPVAVEGGLTFASLTAGSQHTCGLTDAGTAYCWGFNFYGQLGNTTNVGVLGVYTATPQPVIGGHTFVALTTGHSHTCGLTPFGAAYCWGDNTFSAMGDPATSGSDVPNPTPFAVSGGLAFTELAAGGASSCGLTGAGAAYCWGSNWEAQLGTAADIGLTRTTPEPVSGVLQFTDLSVGGAHTCGRTSAGTAYCWGNNTWGQLGNAAGNNSEASRHPTPAAVDGGLTFAALTAGRSHTCGLSDAGVGSCWGTNTYGELGNTTNSNTYLANPAPTAVTGLTFAIP